ncbi:MULTISPECIES: hypothetical protein [unclassified Ruegeria]|uniref:hypothetical protein n=1 Tax=unclassified Ruegeria TaxID=2625375 RepID=UPI001487EEB7|nr:MULTISPECIES: hypothetical protein [unclassified Ruegeria]
MRYSDMVKNRSWQCATELAMAGEHEPAGKILHAYGLMKSESDDLETVLRLMREARDDVKEQGNSQKPKHLVLHFEAHFTE